MFVLFHQQFDDQGKHLGGIEENWINVKDISYKRR
jgi:hypothetical protein